MKTTGSDYCRSRWRANRVSFGERLAPHRRKLTIEPLEDRRLLALYVVDWPVDEYYATAAEYPTDGHLSLREALEAANQNTQVGDAEAGSPAETDVISFHPDLYAGDATTILLDGQQLEIADDVDIQGPGAESLTIDAQSNSRVFHVNENVEAAIVGLTIAHGSSSSGGGIHNDRGTLTVTNSTLSDNSADNIGGGICIISGTLTITNSTLSGNSAGNEGGGVFNASSTLKVTNSTLSGNSADIIGGGICNHGTLTVANSTLSDNSADIGGGIFNRGTLTVTNSTLSGNSAGSEGGGIWYNSGTLTAVNTIVAGNHAPDNRDVRGSFSTNSDFNLIGILTDEQRPEAGEHTLSGDSESPTDPGLTEFGPLGNGQWGYYLLPDSPALNAGSNDLARDPEGNPLLTDQAGRERIQNDTVDIGAVEGLLEPWIPAVTYLVESFDRTVAADGILTFWEALEAASGNLPVGDAPAGSPHEQDRIEFAAECPDTLLLDGKPITLRSNLAIVASTSHPITIDAQGNSRVFELSAGFHVLLEGLTVTGGFAEDGAGIYNRYGTLTVTNSTLSGNSAERDGGGIYNFYGALTVTNSTLLGNSAGDDGGGIYAYRTTLTATKSNILGNSTGDRGGGIHASQSCEIQFTDGLISDNNAHTGGGISIRSRSTADIIGVEILGNSADDGGGGIYNEGTLTVTNSALAGNSTRWGGGIWNEKGTLTITNSTLSGNCAIGTRGGGIWNYEGTLTLTNSIVALNDGSEIDGTLDAGSGFNLIGEDPSFIRNPSPGTDGTWGTEDDDRGNLRLRSGSPAIDEGDPAYLIEPEQKDLAGNPRVVGERIDIGAYEYFVPDALVWDGQGDGLWSQPGRWTGGQPDDLPDRTTEVLIEVNRVAVDQSAEVWSLVVEGGGQLAVSSDARLDLQTDLTLNDTATLVATINETVGPGLAAENTAMLDGRLILEADGPLGDVSAGQWGPETRTILEADGGLGGSTFAATPAIDEHLGHGVFYKGITYNDTSVDVELFRAAPGDVNGDGRFMFDDLIAIFSQSGPVYGKTDVADRDWTNGDFTGDGCFLFDDLIAAFSTLGPHYGKAYPMPPAAPPAAMSEETAASLQSGGLSGALASLQTLSQPVEASPAVTPEPTDVAPLSSGTVPILPQGKWDCPPRTPKTAAHDAVLSDVVAGHPASGDVSLGELAWFVDHQRSIVRDRPTGKQTSVQATLETLLATWP